jgi:hypothetical protein
MPAHGDNAGKIILQEAYAASKMLDNSRRGGTDDEGEPITSCVVVEAPAVSALKMISIGSRNCLVPA